MYCFLYTCTGIIIRIIKSPWQDIDCRIIYTDFQLSKQNPGLPFRTLEYRQPQNHVHVVIKNIINKIHTYSDN